MTPMQDIDSKAAEYSAAREALAGAVAVLKEERAALNRKYLPRIRRLVESAKERRAQLSALVEANPGLFERPRTVILHGVKLGYQKAKGRIEWDDEAAVIARIRKLLPRDQAELLIRVRESVHKPGVYDLSAADLKRLGITIEGDGDELVIRDTAGEVDKLVEALLREEPEEIAG